jgi:hypothetical protein
MYEFIIQNSDILANLIVIGTPVLLFLGWSHSSLSKRLNKIDEKIEKLCEIVTDIDRRVCRIEGALSNKDCCVLKDDRSKQKAE